LEFQHLESREWFCIVLWVGSLLKPRWSLSLCSCCLLFFPSFCAFLLFCFLLFPLCFLNVLSFLWCQITNQYHGSQASSHCFQACDRSWICKLGVTLGIPTVVRWWSHWVSCDQETVVEVASHIVLAFRSCLFPSSWFLSQSLASTSRKRFKLVLALSVVSMEISGSHESEFSNKGWTHERHQLSHCPS